MLDNLSSEVVGAYQSTPDHLSPSNDSLLMLFWSSATSLVWELRRSIIPIAQSCFGIQLRFSFVPLSYEIFNDVLINGRFNKNLPSIRLSVYSFTLHQERVDKWERIEYSRQARYCYILQRVICQLLRKVLISATEGIYRCNGRGTYPYVPDEAPIYIHLVSYVVSVSLILLLILFSSVPCVGVRFQSTTCT